MRELLMDVQNISKKFPGVQALKDVCFPVYEGEIHALVGEKINTDEYFVWCV